MARAHQRDRRRRSIRAARRTNRDHVTSVAGVDVVKLEAKWAKTEVDYPADTQILYASVSRNLQPILNASVRALVHRPSGDYISVELYDNGKVFVAIGHSYIYSWHLPK